MATTVDTLLVRIEADMADLKRDLDRLTSQVDRQTNSMSAAFGKVGKALTALAAGAGLGMFLKSVINTGASVEGLRVQLNALLGSTEEGGRAFQKMTEFAARVPFSLEQIQSASGSLAAASKDADQLGELMQVTGNIAAQFNIPFEQAAENVQRAMSAGAASADLFQQKGVNAFMGFKAGVSYSSAETTKTLLKYFGTGGKYDGAMGEFAKTTGGALSMFGDAMFKIRRAIAEGGLNEGFRNLVNAVTELLGQAVGLASAIGGALGGAFNLLAGAVSHALTALKLLGVALGAIAAQQIGLMIVNVATMAAGFTRYVNVLNISIVAARAMTVAQAALNVAMSAAGGPIGIFLALIGAAASALILFRDNLTPLSTKLSEVDEAQKKLNAAVDAFNKVNSQENRDKVVSLAGDLDQLRDAAKQAAEAQLKNAKATLASFAAIKAQQIDSMDLEGQALLGYAEDARRQISYLEGIIKDAENANSAAANLPARTPTQFSTGSEEDKKAASKLKSILEGTRTEYAKIKEQIDLVTAAMPKLSGKMKEQATDALVVLNEKLRETDPLYATLKDSMISASSAIASSFADALVEGKNAMEGLKDTFKNFVKVMISKALELYVFNHILNSVFNLTGSAALPTRTLGKKATGGALQPNQPTLVGERGPELIVPHSAGTIMNAHNTRNAMGGGGGVTVVQNLNVSAGVSQTVRAEMMAMLPVFKQNTMAAVVDARKRGGSFGQAFG